MFNSRHSKDIETAHFVYLADVMLLKRQEDVRTVLASGSDVYRAQVPDINRKGCCSQRAQLKERRKKPVLYRRLELRSLALIIKLSCFVYAHYALPGPCSYFW